MQEGDIRETNNIPSFLRSPSSVIWRWFCHGHWVAAGDIPLFTAPHPSLLRKARWHRSSWDCEVLTGTGARDEAGWSVWCIAILSRRCTSKKSIVTIVWSDSSSFDNRILNRRTDKILHWQCSFHPNGLAWLDEVFKQCFTSEEIPTGGNHVDQKQKCLEGW